MIHDIHGRPRPDLQKALEPPLTPLGQWILYQLSLVRTAQAVYGAATLTLGLVNFLFLVWVVFS